MQMDLQNPVDALVAMRSNLASPPPRPMIPEAAPKPQYPVGYTPTMGTMPTAQAITSGGRANFGGHWFAPSALQYIQQAPQLFPGLHLTSGGRDPDQNARSGGVPNSLHLQGRAADFVGPASQMYAAVAWAKAHGAREAMVHNAGSGFHAHLAW